MMSRFNGPRSVDISDDSNPPADRDRDLCRRLRERDPVAPTDLAVAFLEPLIAWLAAKNRAIPGDIVAEAAEDAILALIRSPDSYDPAKSDLRGYLGMSAQGDLRNVLRREKKHHAGRISFGAVEHSDLEGKYLGMDDDPSLPTRIEEELRGLGGGVPSSVRDGLTTAEVRVLDLMLLGERRTGAYAVAYGIADLAPPEQRLVIKQVKDKLKKRLDRARRGDEHAS